MGLSSAPVGGEEQALPAALPQASEQVAVEHGGGASAAGASGVHILLFQMVQQQPAVGVVFRHVHTVLPEEVGDDLLTQQPQIAGDDEVVVLRGGGGSSEVRPQGVVGGGSHGGPHVVGIGDAPVHDASAGDVGDKGPSP